jgi:hypothetical protein
MLRDEKEAVTDLYRKIAGPDMHSVLFFCSSQYDLDILGPELKRQFQCPLVGCTTAGEISSKGYTRGGITAASFSDHHIRLHPHIIHPLDRFTLDDALNIVQASKKELTLSRTLDKEKMLGLLLIDGLSVLEEKVVSYIHSQFQDLPIIGGSAGDDLRYRETKIYADGTFISNAASLTLIETLFPFIVFKTQHFKPTALKMVITEADPARRIVHEINAEPAADEYARTIGIPVTGLNPRIFSKYPLMIRIADNWQVRSIKSVNDDKSLTFYCAIDKGLVLTLADGVDLISGLKKELNRLTWAIPDHQLIIGCDCVLRRLEVLERQLSEEFSDLLGKTNFIGFSTYGEQFNSVHVNQTLTGVIIGGDHEPDDSV